ncbi:MAG: DUF4835 family protein [Balneolales bacterium]|nr:DUF4835 family protein [Balneolales bacterium]
MYLLTILIVLICTEGYAQEIKARVDVNTSQISTSDYDYLNSLKPLIEDYINDTRWTDDTFLEDERIEVNIQIALMNVDSNANFDANIIIQSSRPIYNTIARTPILLINDTNWRFNFSRNRNIIRDDQQFDDLASVIDFYMYIVLAYDYDSFSELGGSPFLRRADNILNVAQSSGGGTGWSSMGTRRSRHGLITQLNNPNYEGVRIANYKYHRLGLDQFTLDPDRARQNILSAFELLRDTRRQTTERYLFDLMFAVKNREFTAAFMDAELNTRLEAYNLLVDMDNSHISEYEKLQ